MEDRRARLKALIRKNPVLAILMQWIFDPAFTPSYLIDRWVKSQNGIVLNFGAGSRKFGPNVLNLDIEPFGNVQIVNKSDRVPFQDNSCDAILLEYVLEHVENYEELLKEIVRVLKPGGSILVTVPFRQNYHACPHDYWRFTHEGLKVLFEQFGFQNIQIEVYGGPASAWIDATKEFLAAIFSLGIPFLYDILSQLLIIPFIPLRYLDIVLRKLPVARYTAFSFKLTAQKRGAYQPYRILDFSVPGIQALLWAPDNYQIYRRDRTFWIERV